MILTCSSSSNCALFFGSTPNTGRKPRPRLWGRWNLPQDDTDRPLGVQETGSPVLGVEPIFWPLMANSCSRRTSPGPCFAGATGPRKPGRCSTKWPGWTTGPSGGTGRRSSGPGSPTSRSTPCSCRPFARWRVLSQLPAAARVQERARPRAYAARKRADPATRLSYTLAVRWTLTS